MMVINIPGFKKLKMKHLILDFNGTIALDGHLLDGIAERLISLSEKISIHVVTADTMENVRAEIQDLPINLEVLQATCQDIQKLNYIQKLGVDCCVCIGNGRNDRLMLEAASLGVAVLGTEGVFPGSVQAADLLVRDIYSALDLFSYPRRLIAGLRS